MIINLAKERWKLCTLLVFRTRQISSHISASYYRVREDNCAVFLNLMDACASEENPPIQQLLDSGVVPCLIRFLRMNDNPALQLEAAEALTSITSSYKSDHIRYVVEAGVVPILIRLLSSRNDGVASQAAWALGNIAGENDVKYRDIVLAEGALPSLLQAAEDRISELIIFAISNLCRGEPFPDFEVIRPALPLLGRLLDSQNEGVVKYSCVSLSLIAGGPNYCIDAILDERLNIMPRLIQLLAGSTSTPIVLAAVRAIGNISSGDDIHTQSVLPALPSLLWLLDYPDKEIRRCVCWILSNITAGTTEQIQAMINAAVFPKLLEQLKSDDIKIQKEALRAVYNAIRVNKDQTWYLIREDVIPLLCGLLLQIEDVQIIIYVLKAFIRMLIVGKKEGKLQTVIGLLNCDEIKVIQQLKDHLESKISYLSKIIDIYLNKKA